MNAPDAVDAVDVVDVVNVVDVVALGESMVTFLPTRPGRLADVPSFERGIGGAESNVACGLAAAGHAVRWVSRVGADGFGDHLVEAIGSYGVDVTSVRRDAARPTGVYFRTAGERGTDAHEVAYYRAGSAASAMSVANVDLGAVRAARILHLTGITAALSTDCLALLQELTSPGECRPLISFDVNHRPDLWRDAGGAGVVLDLARRADLVFVGEDEAEQAWGVTGGPSAIRELLPEPGVLVVKQGGRGATAFVSSAAERGLSAQFPAPLEPVTDPESNDLPGLRAAEEPGPAPAQPVGTPANPPSRLSLPAAEEPGPAPAQPVGASNQPSPPSLRAVVPPGAARAGAGGPPSGGGTPPARVSDADPASAPTPSASEPTEPTPPFAHDTVTFVPALHVDVVATTGAGDAFAAGFLSATLRGLPLKTRLRHAHLHAAATLTTPGDLAAPPTRDTTDHLAALDDATWETLRLGPGWTQAAQAPEEVRTP
ncbi:PfkB family carbohydrate kinase [Streptomyces sp. S.PB5]|uniref:PfkB family carbohydrate kinase n=1 Tax=Streptomyces sp. S.PB5 TaxID=3020844 RepID=UPI0025AF9055|nr:PfkB family carbohydrate kinase [Streptomyces sp. S.PB5]MDN3028157.1 PfkB family carbohydrate kinase [Streptomyces sp. S.PB5]